VPDVHAGCSNLHPVIAPAAFARILEAHLLCKDESKIIVTNVV
jgi:hypothetical protein